jgi:hypothetical protein
MFLREEFPWKSSLINSCTIIILMDKVLSKAAKTRETWWTAIKVFARLKGYHYYMPPKELKYRYPAPGSVKHTEKDMPHLFKQHWKNSFRDSPYNIRPKEKLLSSQDVPAYMIKQKHLNFDPNNE